MIYSMASRTWKKFILPWIQTRVREVLRRNEQAYKLGRTVQLYMIAVRLARAFGSATPWLFLQRLCELKEKHLVRRRNPRWDLLGATIQPNGRRPDPHDARVLQRGTLLSQTYDDHLRVDAANVLARDPRMRDYILGFLTLPCREITWTHALAYVAFHKTKPP